MQNTNTYLNYKAAERLCVCSLKDNIKMHSHPLPLTVWVRREGGGEELLLKFLFEVVTADGG